MNDSVPPLASRPASPAAPAFQDSSMGWPTLREVLSTPRPTSARSPFILHWGPVPLNDSQAAGATFPTSSVVLIPHLPTSVVVEATHTSLPRIDDHACPSKAKFCGTQPCYNNFPCDNLQNDASPAATHERLTTAICRKNPTLGGAGERERPLQKKSQLKSAHTPQTTDGHTPRPPTPRRREEVTSKKCRIHAPAQGYTRRALVYETGELHDCARATGL